MANIYDKENLNEKAKAKIEEVNNQNDPDCACTDDTLSEWADVFRLFDKNGDGHIDVGELDTAMRGIGGNPTPDEVKQLIADADLSGDGVVDWSEFIIMMLAQGRQNKNKSQEEMQMAFKTFDKDGNGFISAAELRETMKCLGDPMSEEDINEMMKEADTNGDGKIDYKEFAKVICN